MRLNDCDTRPWYEDTDETKRVLNRIYGAKVFGIKVGDEVAAYCNNDVITTKSLFDHFQANYGAKTLKNKEDTKMNNDQDANNKRATDNNRRAIMNKLKVGDKICTSANMTTPMEIFAFDYQHLRVGLKHRISGEGYERVRQFWIDPLTIIDPDVHNKVSYTNYYRTPNRIPTPKKIIISEDSMVTVVLWDDGTKTVVKCSDADTYDPYTAYCAAFAKKCYGTNSQLKKTIEKLTVYQDTKVKNRPCPNESLPPDPLQSRFRMMDFTYLKENKNAEN